jgi:multidrug resistance efflux pump
MLRRGLLLAASLAAFPFLPPAAAPAEPACYLGVLVSRNTTLLAAPVAGELGPLQISIGQPVAAGQELARVLPAGGRHALDQERARLEAAKSAQQGAAVESRRARRELERRQGAKDLFSTEQIEAAEFQLERSLLEEKSRQAMLAEAEAALARLESEARSNVLRAPFAGSVAAIHAAPGTRVEAGRPVLGLLAGERPLIRFAVPPGDLHHFPLGAAVAAELKGGSRLPVEATVETVAPELDAPSQMVFVEAGSPAEAWAGVPIGAVLRVAAGREACGETPVVLLPDEAAPHQVKKLH